jgi:hypothetical protein
MTAIPCKFRGSSSLPAAAYLRVARGSCRAWSERTRNSGLLHEVGAEVEVLARQPRVYWLDQKLRWLKSQANPIRPLLYPPTDVDPPGLNLIVAWPELFKRLPRLLQEKIARRSIRPPGSCWLVPRVRNAHHNRCCSEATLHDTDPLLVEFASAQLIVRVRVTRMFPNRRRAHALAQCKSNPNRRKSNERQRS